MCKNVFQSALPSVWLSYLTFPYTIFSILLSRNLSNSTSNLHYVTLFYSIISLPALFSLFFHTLSHFHPTVNRCLCHCLWLHLYLSLSLSLPLSIYLPSMLYPSLSLFFFASVDLSTSHALHLSFDSILDLFQSKTVFSIVSFLDPKRTDF